MAKRPLPRTDPLLSKSWRQRDVSPTIRASLFSALLSATVDPTLRERVIKRLAPEASPLGTWNFWLRDSPDAEVEPYPDDLDDTACVTGLLALNNRLTPQMKARFVKVLISLEVKPGGPYRTWCTNDSQWDDVDPVVNANACWTLKHCGVQLPNLEGAIRDWWRADTPSPYYPSAWVRRYLVARSLYKPHREQKILAKYLQEDPPATTLAVAAALLTCRVVGVPEPSEWHQYLQTNRAQLEPLITERAGANPTYAGSILASASWSRAALQKPPKREKTLTQECRAYARMAQELQEAPALLAYPFLPILGRLRKADRTGSIASVSITFAKQCGLQVPRALLVQLERATIWGWLTYTLTDNLLDADQDTTVLPSIQWGGRNLVLAFTAAVGDGFASIVDEYLTRVDAANMWEQTHGRLPKNSEEPFPALSERSIAHVLGPLGVLFTLGLRPTDDQWSALVAFMGAYLSLRQHLDDSHDWLDDHEKGIRTAIGDVVRAHARKNAVTLRQAFATRGSDFVIQEGERYTTELKQTREALPKAWRGFLQKEQDHLLDGLERFRDAVAFVEAFKQP